MKNLLLIIPLLLPTLAFSSSWWNTAWPHRIKISLDRYGPSEHLPNFPVMIKLDPTRINYKACQPNGADLRFLDASQLHVLPHEIENWTEGGESIIWVKIPAITTLVPQNQIWLYFGNQTVAATNTGKEVWSDQYRAVWHMNEVGTDNRVAESTRNACHGTVRGGMKATSQVKGPVGKGLAFDGKDDHIMVGDKANLRFERSDSFSFMAWARVKDASRNSFFSKMDCKPTWRGYNFFTHGTTARFHMVMISRSNVNIVETRSVDRHDDDTWRFFCATYDGSSKAAGQKLYVNGKLVASEEFYNSLSCSISSNAAFMIGNRICNDTHLNGSLDEIRVVKGALSGEWIKAQYVSQMDGMATYYPAETTGIIHSRGTNPCGNDIRIKIVSHRQQARIDVRIDGIEKGPVVTVYDVAGQRVKSLAADARMPAGRVSYVWRFKNDRGEKVRGGLYIVRGKVQGESVSQRLLYVR